MRYDLIAHRCDLYDTEDLDQRIRAQLYMEQPSYYARYCEKYRSADPANLALLKCFLDLSVNAELFHQHKTGIIIGTNDGITVKQKQFTRLALEGNSNPFFFRLTASNLLSSLLSIYLDTEEYSTTLIFARREFKKYVDLSLRYIKVKEYDFMICGYIESMQAEKSYFSELLIVGRAGLYKGPIVKKNLTLDRLA